MMRIKSYLTLFTITLLVVTCSEKSKEGNAIYYPDMSDAAVNVLKQLRTDFPDDQYIYKEFDLPSSGEVDPNSVGIEAELVEYACVYLDRKKFGLVFQLIDESDNDDRDFVGQIVSDEIFDEVDIPAKPVGGIESFYQYISSNMKYPKEARRKGVQGKVFVQFIVDELGSIVNVKCVKGIGAGCDDEAMRVISNSSEKWKPGLRDGRPVKVRMILPITFRLN